MKFGKGKCLKGHGNKPDHCCRQEGRMDVENHGHHGHHKRGHGHHHVEGHHGHHFGRRHPFGHHGRHHHFKHHGHHFKHQHGDLKHGHHFKHHGHHFKRHGHHFKHHGHHGFFEDGHLLDDEDRRDECRGRDIPQCRESRPSTVDKAVGTSDVDEIEAQITEIEL